MPTAKKTGALWPLLVIAVAALAAGGCSTSNTTSGLSLVDAQGNHPANFLATHPGFAVSSVSQCTTCHGDDLKGGIANTSCFTAACHHGTVPGWVATPPAPQPHGASAKKAPGSSGFVSCRICHGNDFLGGSVQVACLNADCHGGGGQSPHPAQWRSGDTYVHMTTDEANASVCAQCHLNGNNSPIGAPSPPAPGGTPPGCFNSTLCHGAAGGHPAGWVATPPADQPHGDSAKAAPGATTGFAYCQVCHGNDFTGGVGTTCLNNSACHGTGVQSPHPSQWLPGASYVHTTTNEGNAPVCALCHYNEPGAGAHAPTPPPAGVTVGCFNNTLCHGAGGAPHPLDNTWVAAPPADQPHGDSAKAAPGATTGFAYCQICHGNDFTGGIGTTCLNNGACHGTGVQSPHPPQWFQGDAYVHIDTNEGNAPVCALCHYNEPGAGAHAPTPPPAGVTVGCFNNTLCHGASASFHPAGWFAAPPGPQPHGQSAKAPPSGSSGFAYCRVCHGTSTGNYNGGAVQFSCLIVACHGGGGLSPHAAQWLPGQTYVHTTTDPGNAPECAFCHYGESGGGNHPPTPPPAGSTPGCTNNTLCHGA
jgi:hypothetical protein